MKIWDNSIRNCEIFNGSGRLIGEFEGNPLIFPEGHRVFRRCLANQSFWAAVKCLGGQCTADSMQYDVSKLDEQHRAVFMKIVRLKQQELNQALNLEVNDFDVYDEH